MKSNKCNAVTVNISVELA